MSVYDEVAAMDRDAFEAMMAEPESRERVIDALVDHFAGAFQPEAAGDLDAVTLGAEARQVGPFLVLDQVPVGPDRLAGGGGGHQCASSKGVAPRPRSTMSKR